MTANTFTRRRVLIVDDDRALRHALAALLTEAGYTVQQAGDGTGAISSLEDDPFDIVLLDIGLPGMSGLDVLERMRASARPPLVIVMTADDTSGTLLEAVRRQAFRYLRKPFAPAAIVEVIEEAIAAAPHADLPIEVVSAKPEWLEIIAPCTLQMTERI